MHERYDRMQRGWNDDNLFKVPGGRERCDGGQRLRWAIDEGFDPATDTLNCTVVNAM